MCTFQFKLWEIFTQYFFQFFNNILTTCLIVLPLWTLNLWWSFQFLFNDTHGAFSVSKLLELSRTDCASNFRNKSHYSNREQDWCLKFHHVYLYHSQSWISNWCKYLKRALPVWYSCQVMRWVVMEWHFAHARLLFDLKFKYWFCLVDSKPVNTIAPGLFYEFIFNIFCYIPVGIRLTQNVGKLSMNSLNYKQLQLIHNLFISSNFSLEYWNILVFLK